MTDILAPFRARRRPRGFRIITARPLPDPSIRQIIADVAARHGVSARDIISDRRTKAIIPARQEAMFLATKTMASLPTIAAQFRRDPTTIGHAARAYARRLAAGWSEERAVQTPVGRSVPKKSCVGAIMSDAAPRRRASSEFREAAE